MPRILPLPPSVVTKIAAGEVIERPASVVKEMLENSLDAEARRIDIELEGGGVDAIVIVDDGIGIEAEDLPLVFASHATSKLRSADDLFSVTTLGFRGEAMASIGGVSHALVQSVPRGRSEGAQIECMGGEIGPVRPWSGALGTRIAVRHLFFNTPVRRKFLRSTATELGHVVETVTRIGLAHPGLHLVLRHNGKLVHEITAQAGLLDRIGHFFGQEVRQALLPVEADLGPVQLRGYIADPACDRGHARMQYLFVNGRCIRDRSLGHALQEAYRGLLMAGRFAVAFLFLNLPPDQVDVNVHPTKAEVRFRDAQGLYHLVRSAVKRTLTAHNLVPRLTVPSFSGAAPASPSASELAATIFDSSSRRAAGPATPRLVPPMSQSTTRPSPPASSVATPVVADPPEAVPHAGRGDAADATPPARAIQIHDAYLVVETPEGMLVVDQHALHERILFEQLRRRVQSRQLEVQRLLIPEPIELTREEAAAVLEAEEALRTLGLEVTDYGGGTVAVSSYPALLGRVPVTQLFSGIVEALTANDRPPDREQLFEHLLASMACKAAVKAGDRLAPEEIDALMRLRPLAENSHHCPHGRPTSLVLSRRELDRQFRRI